LSYLVITHNLAITRHISDVMAVFYIGRLLGQGPTAAGFSPPAPPPPHGLFAAPPVPPPPPPPARVQRHGEGPRLTHPPPRGEVPSLMHRPTGCEFHTRCPHAEARCRTEEPVERPLAPDHPVRCHFPLGPAS